MNKFTFKEMAMVALVIVVAGAAAVFLARSALAAAPRFAMVDVASIVRTQQSQSTALLARPDADQGARRAALEAVSELGKRIDAELQILSHECKCTILLKEAVVAPGKIEDITSVLAARLTEKGALK